MEIRFVDLEKDYETFKSWWDKHDHTHVPQDMLGAFGFIALENETPVAAAWLCPFMGSKTAMLRFPVTNPDVSKEVKDEGIQEVLISVHELAKELNYKYVLCSTNHKGLIKRLKNLNYKTDAEGCQHLLGVI